MILHSLPVLLVGFVTALASAAALAASPDPLQSPACLRAIADLDGAERAARQLPARVEPARGDMAATIPASVRVLRAAAAAAGLGAGPDVAPRRRAFQPPVSVMPMPPAPRAGSMTRLPAPLATTAPPTRNEPPKSVTVCDSAGCWASDGSRLQRFGPNLVGPNGFCSVHGGVLTCP